jgi:hypothetical protein
MKMPSAQTVTKIVNAAYDDLGLNAPDEATRELRQLTRTKNKLADTVSVRMAISRAERKVLADEAMRRALEKGLGGKKRRRGAGKLKKRQLREGVKKMKAEILRGETATELVPEVNKHTQQGEPMIAAVASPAGNGFADTVPPTPDLGKVFDMALESGTPVAAPTPSQPAEETPSRFAHHSRFGDPTTRKRNVWWRPNEELPVLALAAKKLRERGVGFMPERGDRNGSAMLLEVLVAAQEELLPIDRRKKLTSRWNLEQAGLIDGLKHALRESHRPRLQMDAPKVEAATEAAPVAPVPSAQSAAPIPFPTPAGGVPASAGMPPLSEEEAADPILHAANALMIGLRVQFRKMKDMADMNALLIEEVDGLRKRTEANERRMDALEKIERKAEAVEKARLPSCAVLGVHKDEFAHIKMKAEEAGLQVELRFYDQDTSPRPVSTDWAIAMKFINHGWNDHLKACMTRGQYQFVRGGITNMMRQLEVWFATA